MGWGGWGAGCGRVHPLSPIGGRAAGAGAGGTQCSPARARPGPHSMRARPDSEPGGAEPGGGWVSQLVRRRRPLPPPPSPTLTHARSARVVCARGRRSTRALDASAALVACRSRRAMMRRLAARPPRPRSPRLARLPRSRRIAAACQATRAVLSDSRPHGCERLGKDPVGPPEAPYGFVSCLHPTVMNLLQSSKKITSSASISIPLYATTLRPA